jgi:ATP-dependent DNA helicase RecG
MVLDYVRAHGRMTRKEVMDLCRVNANQAAYLLQRLVHQGRLSRQGARRGAYYTLVEQGNMRKE